MPSTWLSSAKRWFKWSNTATESVCVSPTGGLRGVLFFVFILLSFVECQFLVLVVVWFFGTGAVPFFPTGVNLWYWCEFLVLVSAVCSRSGNSRTRKNSVVVPLFFCERTKPASSNSDNILNTVLRSLMLQASIN